MPTIKGQLLQQQLAAQGVFLNQPQRRPRVGALAMAAAVSSAKINTLYSDPEKKRNVELWWPEPLCGAADSTDADDCDITATKPTSNKKVYTLDNVIQSPNFKLTERDFETSTEMLEQTKAINIINSQTRLLENFSAEIVTFLDTVANKTDISSAGFGGLSTAVNATSKDIEIDSVLWNTTEVFRILWETANRLGLRDPVILAGGAMSNLLYTLAKDPTVATGKGGALRASDFDIFQDFRMDGITASQKIFMVERGVLGILNRPDWNTKPKDAPNDRVVWSERIFVKDELNLKMNKVEEWSIGMGMNGKEVSLIADVDMQTTCDARTEITEAYRYILNADIVRSPDTDCAKTAIGGKALTGIVGFMNAADA